MKFMNVLLRADAGVRQGTGHVMRCLTLGQALMARGHVVSLTGDLGGVAWLSKLVEHSGIQHIRCAANELDVARIVSSGFDWVVVDSYSIPPELVSRLNRSVPCLAIVDGDFRGISADLYLDQNLGTKLADSEELSDRLLAGNSYALIRDAILEHRRPPESVRSTDPLRVVTFMGGTDPYGAIVTVAESIATERLGIELDVVAPSSSAAPTRTAVAEHPGVRVIEPTEQLPEILGHADLVVSAAGTSAWDICTMARPAIFVSLVDNQADSLAAIARAGVGLSIDATLGDGSLSQVGPLVASLIGDEDLRLQLAHRCWDMFDGLGKVRVVEEMERVHQA